MSIEGIIDGLRKSGENPVLGKVVLLREIGEGGMAIVYAGWHESLDIPVAVKFLKKRPETAQETVGRHNEEEFIEKVIDSPC